MIIDAEFWTQHLPHSIEAIYYTKGSLQKNLAIDVHSQFLKTYGLDATAHPLLVLHLDNWNKPFSDHALEPK